ncbi:MAG: hypothetical protein IPN11_03175, partial [Opitutaceae bacterium]|nr:hypothetical protein [Opitutaceae bacterium]
IRGMQSAGKRLLHAAWIDDYNPFFHHLVTDENGARLSVSNGYNYTSESWEWSPARERMYHFRGGVTPSDLLYERIDATGRIDTHATDSPYHSDEMGFRGPLKAAPDGSLVAVGGMILETDGLAIIEHLPIPVQDLAWLDHRLHSLRPTEGVASRNPGGGMTGIWSVDGVAGRPLRVLPVRADRLPRRHIREREVPIFRMFDATTFGGH